MEHTKGPWRYDDSTYIFAVINGSEQMVGETRGTGAGLPQGANGRLMAAAPELLEACRATVASLTATWPNISEDMLLDVVQEAIKKAEGI